MIQGVPKFDGIAAGEGSFSFLGASPTLEVKAAFVNSQSGSTHGWTKNTNWSKAVLEKLEELRVLLEMDLARIHLGLDDGRRTAATAFSQEPGGLGDHVGGGQV